MNSLSKRTVTGLVTMAMALVAVLLVAGPSGAAKQAPASTVTIWSDADRKAAVDRIASAWGTARGVNVVVVQKEFGKIRDDLKTVQAETAPDVIVGAHDWTGDLAASGLVLPLNPRRAVKAQVPAVRAERLLLRDGGQEALRRAGRDREHRPRRQHEAREGSDDASRSCRPRRSRSRRRRRAISRSPCSRVRPVTRTTCIRSSPASAATSSARTGPATSIRPTSGSTTRCS